jgi:hypothetical protein
MTLSAGLVAAFALSLPAVGAKSRPTDTLRVRSIQRPPAPGTGIDSATWGAPQVRIATGQGTASVWLLRAADTLFVAAAIPDSTRSWADALAFFLDLQGDHAAAPAHEDFQWSLRRMLDSSVVYRGRNGRWEPPLDDPDWRIGPEHSGGGWEASETDDGRVWTVLVRLDPAWLEGQGGRRPAIGFLIHDDDPNGWYSWPEAPGSGTLVERTPAVWADVSVER